MVLFSHRGHRGFASRGETVAVPPPKKHFSPTLVGATFKLVWRCGPTKKSPGGRKVIPNIAAIKGETPLRSVSSVSSVAKS